MLLTTQCGSTRLVFVLATSGEMRLPMELRHVQCSAVVFGCVVCEFQWLSPQLHYYTCRTAKRWCSCWMRGLPGLCTAMMRWEESACSMGKYHLQRIYSIGETIVFIVYMCQLLFHHCVYHSTGCLYILPMQLGLAEDMKRSIFTVECQKVKQIDPGLRLIIMSRQASGDLGWRTGLGGFGGKDRFFLIMPLCNSTPPVVSHYHTIML